MSFVFWGGGICHLGKGGKNFQVFIEDCAPLLNVAVSQIIPGFVDLLSVLRSGRTIEPIFCFVHRIAALLMAHPGIPYRALASSTQQNLLVQCAAVHQENFTCM